MTIPLDEGNWRSYTIPAGRPICYPARFWRTGNRRLAASQKAMSLWVREAEDGRDGEEWERFVRTWGMSSDTSRFWIERPMQHVGVPWMLTMMARLDDHDKTRQCFGADR
eukprot:2731695-Rhodomonas_salina.1